jgi:hypothetical protein
MQVGLRRPLHGRLWLLHWRIWRPRPRRGSVHGGNDGKHHQQLSREEQVDLGKIIEAIKMIIALITYLQGRELHDPKAIAVHIQACRLLMTTDLPEAARETVLEGLRKVTSQYAPAG